MENHKFYKITGDDLYFLAHSLHVNFVNVTSLGVLQKGGLGGKEVSIACSVDALRSTTLQNSISVLYAQCEQCACVAVVQTLLYSMFLTVNTCCAIVLPSHNNSNQNQCCVVQTIHDIAPWLLDNPCLVEVNIEGKCSTLL
jgi:hypothetical protein